MNSKHTPGPWEVFGPMKFTVYGGDPKVRIAVIDYCTGADTAEHNANAALISAAPDLLAALHLITEAAIELGRELGEPTTKEEALFDAVTVARAAIAKVEGQQ